MKYVRGKLEDNVIFFLYGNDLDFVLDNRGSWFSEWNLNLTQLNKKGRNNATLKNKQKKQLLLHRSE